jgi:hypothetical protein
MCRGRDGEIPAPSNDLVGCQECPPCEPIVTVPISSSTEAPRSTTVKSEDTTATKPSNDHSSTTEKPTEPVTSKPAETTPPHPSEPVSSKPAESTTPRTSEPVTSKPTEPGTTICKCDAGLGCAADGSCHTCPECLMYCPVESARDGELSVIAPPPPSDLRGCECAPCQQRTTTETVKDTTEPPHSSSTRDQQTNTKPVETTTVKSEDPSTTPKSESTTVKPDVTATRPSEPTDPCAAVRCESGQKCVVESVQCVKAPCPQQAMCVGGDVTEPAPCQCESGHFCTASGACESCPACLTVCPPVDARDGELSIVAPPTGCPTCPTCQQHPTTTESIKDTTEPPRSSSKAEDTTTVHTTKPPSDECCECHNVPIGGAVPGEDGLTAEPKCCPCTEETKEVTRATDPPKEETRVTDVTKPQTSTCDCRNCPMMVGRREDPTIGAVDLSCCSKCPGQEIPTCPDCLHVCQNPAEKRAVELSIYCPDCDCNKVIDATRPFELTQPTDDPGVEPVDTKPVDRTQATKPAETKPVDGTEATKPAETKPVDRTEETKPMETKPTEKPVDRTEAQTPTEKPPVVINEEAPTRDEKPTTTRPSTRPPVASIDLEFDGTPFSDGLRVEVIDVVRCVIKGDATVVFYEKTDGVKHERARERITPGTCPTNTKGKREHGKRQATSTSVEVVAEQPGAIDDLADDTSSLVPLGLTGSQSNVDDGGDDGVPLVVIVLIVVGVVVLAGVVIGGVVLYKRSRRSVEFVGSGSNDASSSTPMSQLA